jgi:chaperone required for assembly of F1-ATPase
LSKDGRTPYIGSMRDILSDFFENEPIDPTESARKGLRTSLRKRFYETTAVDEGAEGFRVLLDGRVIRTPARRVLATPSRALAQAVAQEWDAQRPAIDPLQMPLTRLANSIIDGVSAARDAVRDEVVKYLGSDLLFYRAADPAGLVARQSQHWDPVLAWARETLGARFILSQGIVFVAQPQAAIDAAQAAIPDDLWKLGAVSSVTTLTGSALLALALAHGRLSVDEAWAAARVDEDWNAGQWGTDDLADERAANQRADLDAAALVLAS